MQFLLITVSILFSAFFGISIQLCSSDSTCASNSQCNVSRGCPDGWQGFQRLYGRWCMKTFSGSGTRSWALGKCRNLNATLSGIQNVNEQNFVGNQFSNVSGIISGGVWVGARRRPQCFNALNVTLCTPQTTYAYYWTDGSTHGIDGFTWHPYQPLYEDCVAMYATNRTQVNYSPDEFYNGQLTDLICNQPLMIDNTFFDVNGYVCGKLPSIY